MTDLALRTGSINLGQGFPDTDGPSKVIEAARQALSHGANQYPPLNGTAPLREAIANQRQHRYQTPYNPQEQIVVTTGATEAITAAILALCEPGEEIITFDPAYDVYPAAARFAGARCRRIPLCPTLHGYEFDPQELAAAVNAKTRLVVLNTPHNPTGKIFTSAELQNIADVCIRHNLIAVTDEVYEYLTYEDYEHTPLASLPGMEERTLTVSSAGKTFSLTGWKVGWACGPTHLVSAMRSVKQYLTFASAAPLQDAVAIGLTSEEGWVAGLRRNLAANQEILSQGLRKAGFNVLPAEGGYFLQADVSPTDQPEALDFCRNLPHMGKIVAIPTQAFSAPENTKRYSSLVRFAFCKNDEVMKVAAQRIVTCFQHHR
ncbi:aminotransferase class I/II-fold pyridoxal phosphate-dependent enzyme [Streptomyces meridianus]|uniref:Aminotransferase class I/II-fold pyridoxal phosphate-dependent enzyme n=1 Tax=Streptomyces meridianus TaxID=2938945 RepID=A0ABT0XBC2_9ACTN|nr:aminotransferase class I/II-fold pyridoxal phosphate-dependent enzyme [Streptomyces meridianus]MCM2579600.1 aminotransferase class I/II-fold pyridoxal phosphate-dependent enzyme [Streptomyces meridianus]